MTAYIPLPGNVSEAAAAVVERLRASVVEVRTRGGGAGAGTIWHPDGVVVTNHHVVGGDRAEVVLAGGGRYRADVVARDPENDVAVLRIPARDLPAALVGDSRAIKPGELVLAVGHPFGITGALTVGVVSFVGHANPAHFTLHDSEENQEDQSQEGQSRDERQRRRGGQWWRERQRRDPDGEDQDDQSEARELIYADVLLGPGNSGGPLADARGQVVGINAMVHGPLALAVPSHVVQRFLARPDGRPVLGIHVQNVSLPPALVARAPAMARRGVVITHVVPESAAERAGVLLGDVLVAINGRAIQGAPGLQRALDLHRGGAINLGVLRGGVPREITAVTGIGAAPIITGFQVPSPAATPPLVPQPAAA